MQCINMRIMEIYNKINPFASMKTEVNLEIHNLIELLIRANFQFPSVGKGLSGTI